MFINKNVGELQVLQNGIIFVAKIIGNILVIIFKYFKSPPFLNYKSYLNCFNNRTTKFQGNHLINGADISRIDL